MSKTIGTVLIDVKADTAQLVKGMTSAQANMKKSVDKMKGAILSLGAAYVSFATVAKFNEMVSDSIDVADATSKMAEKMAISTEQLSKYQYAASMAGVSNTELNSAMGAMIRRTNNFVRNGGGAAAKALGELGISAEFARENFTSTEKTFEILVARLAEMPDGFQKTAIAQDLFSKSAVGVLGIANMGTEEIQRLGEEAERIGIVIPNSVAMMAASYHDSIDQLSARFEGAGRVVSYSMLPAMEAASSAALEMYDQMFGASAEEKMNNFGSVSANVVTSLANGAGFVADSWTGVQLVTANIELGFLHMSQSIREVIDFMIDRINSFIEVYNMMADVTGTNKIELFDANGAEAFDTFIADSEAKIESLTNSLTNGREKASEFINAFNTNLSENQGGEGGSSGIDGEYTNANDEEDTSKADEKAQLEVDRYIETLARKAEALQESLMTEDETLAIKAENDIALADEAFQNKLITEQDHKALLLALEQDYQNKITDLNKKGLTERQKFSDKTGFEQTKQVLGDLQQVTSGMANSNKTMFKINKAAALANAAIQLPASIMKTMENYPFPLSVAMAGLQAAAGAAQISSIASASFGGGGSTSTPSITGGYSTTGGQIPSDIGIGSEYHDDSTSELVNQKTININMGDSIFTETNAVRRLAEILNEEIGDGLRIQIG